MSALELQDALDNYDKEGHAQAQMDREDMLVKAAEDVLEEYTTRDANSVSMDTMSKLAVAVGEVRAERKRKGIPVLTKALKDGQGSGGQL